MVVCFDVDFELIILKRRIDNIKDVAYSRVKKKGFSLPAVETVKVESFPMECFEKGYIFCQKWYIKGWTPAWTEVPDSKSFTVALCHSRRVCC